MPGPESPTSFIWYELLTSDPDAAADFYKRAVGWGTEVWEAGERPYTMWTAGGVAVGGLMELPEEARAGGAPPHWLPYIEAHDVAATVARARELGAMVYVEPMHIANVGWIAVLADPQGATFAIHAPEEEVAGATDPPRPGRFSWHELFAADHEAAFDFYQALFGWEKHDVMDMGEVAGIYQMYGLPGADHPLGGMMNKPPDIPAPPHWMLYIMVEDVHAAVDTIKELGGRVMRGPMTVPGGDWIAYCLDPQGAGFAIHSLAGGAEAGAKE